MILFKDRLLIATLTTLALSIFSLPSSAMEDHEEYAPIPELNYPAQKAAVADDYSIFDDVRIHAGLALINSFQDFSIAPGVRERAGVRGLQLGLGVDLFSPHFIVEGVLVNLPETTVDDAKISANGFELRLLYDTAIAEGITLHGGVGVASRGYNIQTNNRADGSVKAGERSFQSGATVLAAGGDYWINESVSAGLEFTDHLPMANGDDPSSLDLAIRLNGHF